MTSVETVLADDPELTVRLVDTARQPDRIVLDTQLRTPLDARVWDAGARRIAVSVRPPADHMEALRARGVEVALVATTRDSRVDLVSALATLGAMEVNEVLVESGPRLAGALLQARRVDELVLYVAPSLLGSEARALAQLPGLDRLDQRLRMRFTDARQVGDDLRITAVPQDA
jgi:diaminohydroxyphosphoribosylaminopyrimidine deaminase/5-amino-6-(5-phosphoribosylamino)uracil reductase